MESKQLVQQMTLEEKAGMCSGADHWHLKGVERLGIESLMVSDGPHGLRKQENREQNGVNVSIQAVCFPTACATACSFDRELIQKMGEALGEECQAEGISVLLGPAVNIKRSPLCGRNFEYFSEDPYLAGEMAKHFILGVQSKKVGTSLKHFAANNQEYRRMTCSSEIDERTLREIYLAAFETAVKEAKPWTMMCSYNRLNGVFASENHRLLTEILREEWGFDGYVMSDWGAVNHRIEALKAGLDLEMPGSWDVTDAEIVKAVKDGRLKEEVLDSAVERILNIGKKYTENRSEGAFEKEKHHIFAKEIELESAVLLKNEGNILPLSKTAKIAFIGLFAKEPRFQGGGSSHINAFKISNALEASPCQVAYAQGYTLEDKPDEELLQEAVRAAQEAEAAVVFAGLPDAFESESYDRAHMDLPSNQNQLIARIAQVQPNTVVVLHNGSPVTLPWEKQVKGILEMYLGGQAVGEAACDLIFGNANPCGKLAETFPLRLEDNPSYLYFPGDGEKSEYREGVFVGYRYYDSKNMPVQYPFGYGLSYTSFAYSNLKLSAQEIKDTDTLQVSVTVKNTGTVAGKEIVELYVADRTGSAVRPKKELKNFAKVFLKPGEEKTVVMELSKRAFAWYHTGLKDWYAASGAYDILVGSSSAPEDLMEPVTVLVTSTQKCAIAIDENTVVEDVMKDPKLAEAFSEYFKRLMEALGEKDGSAAQEAISKEMTRQVVGNLPLRSIRSYCQLETGELETILAKLRAAQSA